jgi:tyrosinase
MVERFHSDPLELPDPEHRISRVDLVVYGIDPSGESYEGRVFIGKKPTAGAGPDHPSYAGSFYVFGHGECWGDEGHCDVPTERDTFDLRLPHHLEPQVAIVTVTDHIRRLIGEGEGKAPVTVSAHTADGSAVETLAFTKLRLLTYA